MMKVASMQFKGFNEFYALNSESLLRSHPRSSALAYLLLIIEYFELFSLTLSDSYFNIDSSDSMLRYVSLHRMPEVVRNTAIMAILVLNLLTVLTIIVLLSLFYVRKFTGLRLRVLSSIIMNYNYVILIPSLLFSTKNFQTKDLLITLEVIYPADIILTIFVSLICSLHSGRFYSYTEVDGLAKKGSIWDAMKSIYVTSTILLIEITERDKLYPFAVIVYAIINIWDMFYMNSYHQPATNQLFTSLNLNVIVFSLYVSAQVFSDVSAFTGIIPIFCSVALTHKLGRLIIDRYNEMITECIDCEINGIPRINNMMKSKKQSIFMIDFFLRRLIEKTSLFKKKQQVYSQMFGIISHFPINTESDDRSKSKNHLGELIDEEENLAIESLKVQINAIQDHFEHSQDDQDQVQTKYKKNQYGRPSFQSMFYLLEIIQNYTKLAIRLQEFMNFSGKRKSIRDEAIIKYLVCEMQKRQEEQVSAISYRESMNQMSDLSAMFQFQEEIKMLKGTVTDALLMKIKFIKEMCQEVIDLEKLHVIGKSFMMLIKQIAIKIQYLKAKSTNCAELSHISKIFVESLWVNPDDQHLRLLWIDDETKKYAINFQKLDFCGKVEFNERESKEFSIMVSLSSTKLGTITKVQSNCKTITGFSMEELLNQSVGILQPSSIASKHNTMIKRGIDKGVFRCYSKRDLPLFIKHKSGFGVQVSLELQLHTFGGEGSTSTSSNSSSSSNRHLIEIGLIGRVSVESQSNKNFILLDISASKQSVELVSSSIFQELLGKYYRSPHEMKGINFSQIMPSISGLKRILDASKQRKMEYESLAILPNNSSIARRKARDSSMNFLESIWQQRYSTSSCDYYRINMGVTHYKKEGEYDLLLVKLRQFQQIDDRDEVENLVRNILIPQLVEQREISEYESQLIINQIFNPGSIDSPYKEGNYSSSSVITKRSAVKHQTFSFQLPRNTKRTSIRDEATYQSSEEIKNMSTNRQFQLQQDDAQMQSDSLALVSMASPKETDFVFDTNDAINVNSNMNTSSKLLMSCRSSNHTNTHRSDQYNKQFQKMNLVFKQRQSIRETNVISAFKTRNNNTNHSNCIINNDEKQEHAKNPKQLSTISLKQSSAVAAAAAPKPKMVKQLQQSFECETLNGEPDNQDQDDEKSKGKKSVTSHLSRQSNSKLNVVFYQRLLQPNECAIRVMIQLYILFSVAIILLIVLTTYFSVQTKLSKQQLAFEFSWWQDQVQNYLVSVCRFSKIYRIYLLYDSKLTQELRDFRDELPSKIKYLYEQFLGSLRDLGRYSFSDLSAVSNIHSLEVEWTFYKNPIDYSLVMMSLYGAFCTTTFKGMIMAKLSDNDATLVEHELLVNMSLVVANINVMRTQQTDALKEISSSIGSSVFITLILILCLSLMITLVFFLFFYKFTSRKEFILKLFATIDPVSLKKMHHLTSSAISKLTLSKQKLFAQQQSLANQLFDDRQTFAQKKKKNGQTTTLEKFSVRLLVKILVILLTVTIQPLVNVFLMSEQKSKTETELMVVSALYQTETQFLICQYLIIACTVKQSVPSQTILSLERLEAIYQSQMKNLVNKVDNLKSVYQSLALDSRYADTTVGQFLVPLFETDACSALEKTKGQYSVKNQVYPYNNELCQRTFSGALTKGFLNGINAFYDMYKEVNEIVQIQDLTIKRQKMTVFYSKFSMVIMEEMFVMIRAITDSVVNCINEEKRRYFFKINLTQVILFLFETIFVILLFPTVIVPYFRKIKQQGTDVINMASILQIQYIVENSYISNFLKSLGK